jgi:hypothetical protein
MIDLSDFVDATDTELDELLNDKGDDKKCHIQIIATNSI